VKTIYKTNKTAIHYKSILKIKKAYFYWVTSDKIAEKYWYNKGFLRTYLASKATKNFTDSKWNKWRRCSVCEIYRSVDEYYKSWKSWYLQSSCIRCEKVKKKNIRIVRNNIWKRKEDLIKSKSNWEKNKWKYNTRRKILRIIWYLDWKWKIKLK